MKRCPKCGKTKPRTEFYSGGYCKPCTKADVLRWVREHPEQFRRTQRRSMLKRRYGLTEEQFDQILTRQASVCPICATALDDRNAVVDHDHTTGRVRGVLCQRCNRTIGLLRDDPALIRKAAAYLRAGAPSKIINRPNSGNF